MNDNEHMLSIARRLALTNFSDIRDLKKKGYTGDEIQTYLERKSFHIMNMINLLRDGEIVSSYAPAYYKARQLAKKEIGGMK